MMPSHTKSPEKPANAAMPSELGRIVCVQTTLTHGVCLLIESINGKVLVPLDAKTQRNVEEALTRARSSDDSFMGSISSLSIH